MKKPLKSKEFIAHVVGPALLLSLLFLYLGKYQLIFLTWGIAGCILLIGLPLLKEARLKHIIHYLVATIIAVRYKFIREDKLEEYDADLRKHLAINGLESNIDDIQAYLSEAHKSMLYEEIEEYIKNKLKLKFDDLGQIEVEKLKEFYEASKE